MFQIISSYDGKLSIVRDPGVVTTDYSKQSLNFDYHTDGIYLDKIPSLVILYCNNEGNNLADTIFIDSIEVLNQLLDYIPILVKLGVVYVGRDKKLYFNKLLQNHLRTGETCLSFVSRGFLQPDIEKLRLAELPTLREVCDVGSKLHNAIDNCSVRRHKWAKNDLIVFDNIRYLHGRISLGQDLTRELYRIWLSI